MPPIVLAPPRFRWYAPWTWHRRDRDWCVLAFHVTFKKGVESVYWAQSVKGHVTVSTNAGDPAASARLAEWLLTHTPTPGTYAHTGPEFFLFMPTVRPT